MATENKTKPTKQSVADFIANVTPAQRQADARTALQLYEEITGLPAVMWGTIIGFGEYHYTYDSGRSGTVPTAGYSPRKANMTFYIGNDFEDAEQLFAALGKHKKSKACLYINKLDDVDLEVLKKIIRKDFEHSDGPCG